MRRPPVLSPLLLLAFLLPAVVQASEPDAAVWKTPTITKDTTWSGRILLRENLVVDPGAVLSVLPGTAVLVEPGKGIGITVLGRLRVSGEEPKRVVFAPATATRETGSWEGLRLGPGRDGREPHRLSGFRIEGAKEGIALTDAEATVTGGVFVRCATGLRGNQKSAAAVDNCLFEGNGTGALLSLGASGTFTACRFEEILETGIAADKGAALRVASSSFARGKTGIVSLTDAPCRVEDCAFSSLEQGIVARQMGKESAVSRCRFENNRAGVAAVQFSTLEVADSTFRGNGIGVDVREFSAPLVRHNRFERNETGVSLFRKSHARVEKNVFLHNRNGVAVNFSSYPLIAGNNFERNDMSVRLEKFQSGDWEERVGSPGITAAEAARRGTRAMAAGEPKTVYPKRVNARGNWWGPDAGRDPVKGTMEKIWDGRRVGPVTYEGFEGEYRVDEVDFSGEEAGPVRDAGPRRGSGPEPPAEGAP